MEGNPSRTGNDKLLGDNWAEYTIFMLSDMMLSLPALIGSELGAYTNLTDYVEMIIRRSYQAFRLQLASFSPDSALVVRVPVSYLQAKVDWIRVVIWLGLQLLSCVGLLLLMWIERRYLDRRPIINASLAPLFTDVRGLLGDDEAGMSNMSYVTSEDCKRMEKLSLTVNEIAPGKTAFAIVSISSELKSGEA